VILTVLLYIAGAIAVGVIAAAACWVYAFGQMLQFFESLEDR
jgi:hypothetical protein